jgi:hypothetical protein
MFEKSRVCKGIHGIYRYFQQGGVDNITIPALSTSPPVKPLVVVKASTPKQ